MIGHYEGVFPDSKNNKRIKKHFKESIPWTKYVFTRQRKAYRMGPEEIKEDPILEEVVQQALNHVALIRGYRGYSVSGLFFNWYKNGKRFTPYHQDQYGTPVITISFGETRDFFMKPIAGGETLKYELKDGDVFVFDPEDDQKHKHSIPKRMKVTHSRLSIVIFAQPF